MKFITRGNHDFENPHPYPDSSQRKRGNKVSRDIREQIARGQEARSHYGISHTEWKKLPSDIKQAFTDTVQTRPAWALEPKRVFLPLKLSEKQIEYLQKWAFEVYTKIVMRILRQPNKGDTCGQ